MQRLHHGYVCGARAIALCRQELIKGRRRLDLMLRAYGNHGAVEITLSMLGVLPSRQAPQCQAPQCLISFLFVFAGSLLAQHFKSLAERSS